MISNLLQNAAKYSEEGGHISLRAEQDGDELVLRVRDDGLGITPEMLPHAFDLFAQAERTLDRAQGGLGIGLTVVKRLVEMHGGRVDAYSEGSGRGTEVVVRLPLAHEPQHEAGAGSREHAPRPAAEHGRRRILVVDDNVDVADSLAMLLRLDGHEVETAYDGPAALAAARDLRPEVALLDIGLPG